MWMLYNLVGLQFFLESDMMMWRFCSLVVLLGLFPRRFRRGAGRASGGAYRDGMMI